MNHPAPTQPHEQNQPRPPRNRENASYAATAIGILSIVLGGLSFVPFFGVISLAGIVLGIIAIVKKETLLGTIGLVVSTIGAATSPFLWVMIGCMFTDCSQKVEDKIAEKLEGIPYSSTMCHPSETPGMQECKKCIKGEDGVEVCKTYTKPADETTPKTPGVEL